MRLQQIAVKSDVLFSSLSVLPSLIDRLGDAKDQVREQDQTLLLKIMEQATSPQVPWRGLMGKASGAFLEAFQTGQWMQHGWSWYCFKWSVGSLQRRFLMNVVSCVCVCVVFQYMWDRMLGGFKHKNNRTREGVCLCLIATLNTWVKHPRHWPRSKLRIKTAGMFYPKLLFLHWSGFSS